MSKLRGILGSDIVKAMKEHEVDPVFIAEEVGESLVLTLAPDDCFLDFGQDLWDNGVPLEECTCRVCGCTDDRACPGGCYWVEEDLCSECAGKGGDAHDNRSDR